MFLNTNEIIDCLGEHSKSFSSEKEDSINFNDLKKHSNRMTPNTFDKEYLVFVDKTTYNHSNNIIEDLKIESTDNVLENLSPKSAKKKKLIRPKSTQIEREKNFEYKSKNENSYKVNSYRDNVYSTNRRTDPDKLTKSMSTNFELKFQTFNRYQNENVINTLRDYKTTKNKASSRMSNGYKEILKAIRSRRELQNKNVKM